MKKIHPSKKSWGSSVAKGGFSNEKNILYKFQNWKIDPDVSIWLDYMGYPFKEIHSIQALIIPVRIKNLDRAKYGLDNKESLEFKKADLQIRIFIQVQDILKIENLSLKKVHRNADYNQVDKRSVDSYRKMWNFDSEITFCLKLFTGEKPPTLFQKKLSSPLRKENRIFLDQLPKKYREKIINFFEANRILVVSDVLKGRGGLSADWMLVTIAEPKTTVLRYILKDINFTMNFFGQGQVKISPKGSLKIGKITMQRKGGTPDPEKLQFKISPGKLPL